MFIRRTQTRRMADGARYTTCRLVRNERIGDRVRQVTLLNLGADFGVPPERWRELTLLVKQVLARDTFLFEPDPELLAEAEGIGRRLQLRSLDPTAGESGAVAAVRLDSLAHEQVRSSGCERLSLSALEQLGFLEVLRGLGMSERDARIAVALVLARMIHPCSEREAFRWLREQSAALELLGLEGGKPFGLNKLHRICAMLWARRDGIEAALFGRERDLLGLSGTVVFFDLTNVRFTGRPASPLARFGRSKQHRNDCPLATLALSLDADGFPRHSEVLAGNVSEPRVLADAIRRLEGQPASSDSDKPTIIMDAGIATEANLAWLRQCGYPWITVRRGGGPPPQREADAAFKTRAGRQAKAWRLVAEDGEAHLCVWSEEHQRKDDAFLARHRARFEAALGALHDGLGKKNHTKRLDKVLQRLGRLRERYRRVHRQYDIEVQPGAKGLAAAIRWNRNDRHALHDAGAGSYALRTSHADWDLETVVRQYWRLTDLEATFRSLKSEMGLRPIWHSKSAQISAHLFIAVLAYHAVHLLRARLAAHGIRDSWWTIRNKLAGWVRITSTLQSAEGGRIVIRQDARPGAEARAIAVALGLQPEAWRRCARMPDKPN